MVTSYGGHNNHNIAWIQKNRLNIGSIADLNSYQFELEKNNNYYNQMISGTFGRQWAVQTFLPLILITESK